MESKGEISFKRRSKGKNARSRKRPRSPSSTPAEQSTRTAGTKADPASDDSGEKQRLTFNSAASRRPAPDSHGISWRDEYQSLDCAVKDGSAALLATAGRHEIDEADERNRQDTDHPEALKEPKKAKSAFGPLRAPTHIRTSIVTDMQPDVCKDYKETGFCGFGDACKFLHDRGVYKAGWQLDKDWAAVQEERRRAVERGEDPDAPKVAALEDVGEDGLPFACFICRKAFKDPVVTLCLHYFCESCALSRMATDSTCAVCKKQLRGVLNTAHKLAAKVGGPTD